MPAFATQAEIVDGPARRRVGADHFMLRPVEVAHAGLILTQQIKFLGLPNVELKQLHHEVVNVPA